MTTEGPEQMFRAFFHVRLIMSAVLTLAPPLPR